MNSVDESLLRMVESDDWRRAPRFEVIETPTELHIQIHMPWADREDVRVDVSSWRCVIRVMPRDTTEQAEVETQTGRPRDARGRFVKRVDVRAPEPWYKGLYRDFERAVPLPRECIPEESEARLNNGVLDVILRKKVTGGQGVYRLPPL